MRKDCYNFKHFLSQDIPCSEPSPLDEQAREDGALTPEKEQITKDKTKITFQTESGIQVSS